MSTPTLILPAENPIDDWHHFYRAKVIEVYDGDTATLLVEQGFYGMCQHHAQDQPREVEMGSDLYPLGRRHCAR